ncbi:hypothetical protein ACW9HQ_15700 [Nocardia gipuzkoensis]
MDNNKGQIDALAAVYLADRAELTAIDAQLMNLASIGAAYIFGVSAVWATKSDLHLDNYQYALLPLPPTALLVVWLSRWRVSGATARSTRRLQKDLLQNVGYTAETLKYIGIMAHYAPSRGFWPYVSGVAMFGTPLTIGAAFATAGVIAIYRRSGLFDYQTIGVGAVYAMAYLTLSFAFAVTLRNQGVRMAHNMKVHHLAPPR